MNKNIIIAILAIIVVAAAGFMIFSHPTTTDGKVNTQINILTGSSLQNGDQVQFELKDAQGNAIAEQQVTIAYDDGSGNIQNYNIFTDANGKGYLTITGEDAGNYDITITYNGNDQYNGCSAKQTITVVDATSEPAAESAAEPVEANSSANTVLYNNATSSSNSTSNGNLHYDSEYNIYYDDSGIIRGGQNNGYSVDYIRNAYENGNMVDEDGNLQ